MSSRRSPLIMMMQPTYFWHFPDQSNLRLFNSPQLWTIHGLRPAREPVMIIAEVCGQEPPQMSLVQDGQVIQAFAANTPDEPLDVGVLPRTSWGNQHFFDSHVLQRLPKRDPIDPVPIAQRYCGASSHGKAPTTC